MTHPLPDLECHTLLAEAEARLAAGQEDVARRLWRTVLDARPDEVRALDGLAQSQFRSQDFESALSLFTRLTRLKPWEPLHWVQCALCAQQLDRVDLEDASLLNALKADANDLLALMVRGEFLARHGRQHEAARSYAAALNVAPPLDQLHPQLRPALQEAMRFHGQYQAQLAAFIDARLDTARREQGLSRSERFDHSIDLMLGRRQRFESRPQRYFMPSLQPIEFFDVKHFPWAAEVEARTADIRREFLSLMALRTDGVPYIQYGEHQPLGPWKELNHSLQWSALHLIQNGEPVAENAQACPVTLATLGATPQPVQAGRTPVAMFSLLKPHTRIPPHVGASNARLVCHLPLVVPPACGFRVGNTTRQWEEGRLWVFDDTIEHEAWNDSEQLRVVLIWDTWHPDLNPEERAMIGAMNAALQEFQGSDTAYGA